MNSALLSIVDVNSGFTVSIQGVKWEMSHRPSANLTGLSAVNSNLILADVIFLCNSTSPDSCTPLSFNSGSIQISNATFNVRSLHRRLLFIVLFLTVSYRGVHHP